MPKKKMENDPDYPQLREFEVGDDCTEVNVWCDGRDYDPDTETYKPQYMFSITQITESDPWNYVGNITGAANELPNLDKASQSLFSFLYASQESYKAHQRGAFTDGNFEMFPPHVNDWAMQNDEHIGALSIACQMKLEQS